MTTPDDWLLKLAIQRFPDRPALSRAALPVLERDQWQVVSNLLGMSPAELARVVADYFGLKPAALVQADRTLAKLIPQSLAIKFKLTPIAIENDVLVVAVSDPRMSSSMSDVRFAAGRKVEVRVAAPDDIETSRLVLYSDAANQANARLSHVLDLDDQGVEFSLAGDKDLVRFCRALIKQAITKRASDIHMHPFAGGGVVRYRIDGQLQRVATIPDLVLASAIRLLKAQGGMDSTNNMVPQDGRAGLRYLNKSYDLRISTLPSSGGEALVIRILDQSRAFSLEKTNFAPWALQGLRRLASRANGLVLITGPTGSGKTSTLYSVLATLNKSSRRIITVEEPVEYKLVGLSQVDVNPAAGLTFARALRSILRQDPDVLLIGEIRDKETAEIAVQAALTGHLVFSTLHTQDALRAIPRLVELGVSPAMLADTLLGVVSQRLMRQLCTHCKGPVTRPLSAMEGLFEQVTGALPGARATGCAHCNYTGYLGRFPVVELVEIPDSVRSHMLAGTSDTQTLMKAMPSTWHSIEHNAANWVMSGLSTPQEAFDCFGLRFWTQLSAETGRDAPIGAALTAEQPTGDFLDEVTALVVSDSPEMAESMVQVAARLGHQAMVKTSATEVHEALLKSRQIQFLVVDISNRSSDLRAFAEDFRASIAWSGLPVVVVFNPAEDQIVAKMEEFGVADYLPIPLDPDLLELRISAVLSRC